MFKVVYEDAIDVMPEPLRLAIEMPHGDNGAGSEKACVAYFRVATV